MPKAMVVASRKPIFPAESARSSVFGRFPKRLQEAFTGISRWIPERRWDIPRWREEFVAWQATPGLL
jgi:hypothetical protein